MTALPVSCHADYHGRVHVHHLALRTDDIDRLARFYEEVLGLTRDATPRAPSTSVWLVAGATRVMIEKRAPGEPLVVSGSMELVAFGMPAAERDEARARLSRAGVTLEAETPHTLYFRDPDGRRVALSHYPEAAA